MAGVACRQVYLTSLTEATISFRLGSWCSSVLGKSASLSTLRAKCSTLPVTLCLLLSGTGSECTIERTMLPV